MRRTEVAIFPTFRAMFGNHGDRASFDTQMYRPSLKPRDRMASLLLVAVIHVGLVFAMLNLSGAIDIVSRDDLTQLIDIASEPPPPPIEEPKVELQAAPEEEGEASPPNIQSKATPIPEPQPRIQLPVPPPMPVSPTPNTGSEPTQGAAPVPGPGTGAGGQGTGTGAGGSGSGPGGGGDGLATVRTRLATRPLSGRDFPNELLDRWPRGRGVFMRFRVDSEGRIIQCIVDQGTGDPNLDAAVCATAQSRLRYFPGVNRSGQRVADWAAYGQRPPR
ncbi:energy transducer TonB [Sphingomonas sp. HDW15A]|uniref:energy transducer TonB n=1 Tax=Sphingomonas sp. HDW15A TaxID=2714942 RepID=UPI00140987D0|nr:energy transducer TonB [Sphingomonas sp. HDW15A]QIK95324.1 energy transducer TonB [Sphingomonas sp. HDW15A]